MRPAGAPREARTLDLTITPLEGQVTGTHLLLELADATQRQRISRDNDLLARLDGSRLMIRQLAHEVKNPLGGLRGAAQLLDRELPTPGCANTPRSSSARPTGSPRWSIRWPDPSAAHARRA